MVLELRFGARRRRADRYLRVWRLQQRVFPGRRGQKPKPQHTVRCHRLDRHRGAALYLLEQHDSRRGALARRDGLPARGVRFHGDHLWILGGPSPDLPRPRSFGRLGLRPAARLFPNPLCRRQGREVLFGLRQAASEQAVSERLAIDSGAGIDGLLLLRTGKYHPSVDRHSDHHPGAGPDRCRDSDSEVPPRHTPALPNVGVSGSEHCRADPLAPRAGFDRGHHRRNSQFGLFVSGAAERPAARDQF